jgi:hypothetical protein
VKVLSVSARGSTLTMLAATVYEAVLQVITGDTLAAVAGTQFPMSNENVGITTTLMQEGVASVAGDGRLVFSLPSFPPSINRLYVIDHNRRRVFLSDEALLWRTHMAPNIKPCKLGFDYYKLTLLYQSPRWLVKDGGLRRVDHSNLDKLTIDTLCAKWGFDDSRLTEVVRRKEWYEWDRIVVILEEGHRLELQ